MTEAGDPEQRRRIAAVAIALVGGLAIGLTARATPTLEPATPEQAWETIREGPIAGFLVPLDGDQLVVLHLEDHSMEASR